MTLGRFLEIGIATEDLVTALEFYESLGFVQATVGEAWPHPYAVVTDGRLSLGLHGTELAGLVPTWTAPNLRHRIEELTRLGLDVERLALDELSLNEAWLRDPGGHPLRLLEARTYSAPPLDPGHESALGYFEELALTAADTAASARFWETLGFVAFEPSLEPVVKVAASSSDLNLGLYQAPFPAPVLVFSAADASDRVATLRSKGFSFARHAPRGIDPEPVALLRAPDGVQIVLCNAAAIG
jgi:catechol 2,3-dioxygenase-like lactoylglutathione lyase family enzyme